MKVFCHRCLFFNGYIADDTNYNWGSYWHFKTDTMIIMQVNNSQNYPETTKQCRFFIKQKEKEKLYMQQACAMMQ